MAQQSKAQGETVERVMHEYKHGELKTKAGEKVTDHRQAVAIALSEAADGAGVPKPDEQEITADRRTAAATGGSPS